MIFQVIGVALGVIGYFGQYPTLLMIGGGICLLIDVIGFASGKMNPVVPIILMVICYFATGSFLLGITYGVVIGNLIDLLPLLIAYGTSASHKSV